MFHRRRASSSDSDETPVVAKSPTTQSRGVKRENSFELDRVRTPRGENEPPRTGLVNTNGIPMEATPSAGMPAGTLDAEIVMHFLFLFLVRTFWNSLLSVVR